MKSTQERRAAFRKAFNGSLEMAAAGDTPTVTLATIIAGREVAEAMRLFDEEGPASVEAAVAELDRVDLALAILRSDNWGDLAPDTKSKAEAILNKCLTDD